MTRFGMMLDTNIVSDFIDFPRGRASQQLRRTGFGGVCLSAVCAAELRYGAAKSGSRRLSDRIEAALGALTVVAFDEAASREYGALRAVLELQGRPLGPNDILIAAHALALGTTLVTHDAAFTRVPGLVVEDWLA